MCSVEVILVLANAIGVMSEVVVDSSLLSSWNYVIRELGCAGGVSRINMHAVLVRQST